MQDTISASVSTDSDVAVVDVATVPADQATTLTADEKLSINTSAINDIVGMVIGKYADESTRSFAIGKRFMEHATWQRAFFTGTYEHGDFINLGNTIRDEVRMHVQIKAESIRVVEWAKSYVLRELVRTDAGDDVSDSLSMFEYLTLIGKALHFDARNLAGEIKPCWLDMIKSVAADRSAENGRVTSDDFRNRIVATEARVKAVNLEKLDPAKAASQAASASVRATNAKIAKSTKDITNAINEGIASGSVAPETALSILEDVAKAHKKPLTASSIGFNPATASVVECEQMIAVMFANGKVVEILSIVIKGIAALVKLGRIDDVRSVSRKAHKAIAKMETDASSVSADPLAVAA